MDQAIRNKLRSVVTQCRRLLEESIAQQLQGKYDIYATGKKDEVRAEKDVPLGHLSDEEREARRDILAHFEHVTALGYKPREALEQLIREIAFTHLNRLCAYKMMEVRDVYVGGQRFREAVSKGLKSQGFLFYLAENPEDERRFNGGQQEEAYRHFLNWLGGSLSQEIGVLFSPTDPANRVYPPQRVLDEVLDLLNSEELKGIWSEDETIGWVYQYFTPKELRDQARKESQAPRNSYELAFRNQFFTPRYVVEFLTDNTLGRIWYEMRRGNTGLKDVCRYIVRRPGEVFFAEKEDEPGSPVRAMKDLLLGGTEETFSPFRVGETQRLVELAHTVDGYERHPFEDQVEEEWWPWAKLQEIREAGELSRFPVQDLLDVLFCQARSDRHGGGYGDWDEIFYDIANEVRRRAIEGRKEDASQEQLVRAITAVVHRARKDPRDIKILDPACGSGHFLLYCFALLLVIYEETYDDPAMGPGLQADYPTKDDLRKAIPGLVLRHNLHGIDIDLRCTQIAALALWLRCQRAYQEMGLKKDRPPILKANVVCAEPMPGEEGLLDEFLKTLREDRLEALIRQVMNVPKDQRVRATSGMVESLSDLVRTVWDKMRLAGEAGSLLKVGHELQDAIRQGQVQWEERLPLFRFTEYGLSEEPKERLVRFVPGDVQGERVTFWDKAETLVRKALDEFVTFVSNGGRFQRQLFVEDALQGLGFVDVCRQHYDVVLMNPPFGAASRRAKSYIEKFYPRTKNDLLASFVEHGLDVLNTKGVLGAITARTALFLSSFSKWRKEVVLQVAPPKVLADLGYGVLDTAKVEAAAYVLEKSKPSRSQDLFFRVLPYEDKGAALLAQVERIEHAASIGDCFVVNSSDFHSLPETTFSYWISGRAHRLFTDRERFENDDRTARGGLKTGDDFRFVRVWWEVPSASIVFGTASTTPQEFRAQTRKGKRWVPFAKGGGYAPFYADIHLVVDWRDDGAQSWELYRLHRETIGGIVRNPDYYFRQGLTWSARTNSQFGIRVLPRGCIFSHKGPSVFVPHGDEYVALGLLSSRVARQLIDLRMANADESQSGTISRSYEVGVIQQLPFPSPPPSVARRLVSTVEKVVEQVRLLDTLEEPTKTFFFPLPQVSASLLEGALESQRWREKIAVEALDVAAEVEQLSDIAFFDSDSPLGIASDDARSLLALEDSVPSSEFDELYRQSIHETIRDEIDDGGGAREVAVMSYYVDRRIELLSQTLRLRPVQIAHAAAERRLLPDGSLRNAADGFFSYCVGCAVGRWDVRLAFADRNALNLPEPFDPLPIYTPGMLKGQDGLPPTESPDGYPLRIDRDGILVDDPEHPDDIIRSVRDVLEVIWKDRADAIEKEACEILGVADLRGYIRKAGAGGFWDDHIKRYSKSRRKAPIYWLLQSSKKNYALWVYYHRLDRDILFKALLNYVEPKIRKEESRLGELRSQKAALGPAAKEGKKFDKEIDRQEALLSELREFEDKLRRAANLHLVPDLNDGVVLNIAPLRELVPWKEAKSYWDDLMDGKYEWSSIGKQLREKGLVK